MKNVICGIVMVGLIVYGSVVLKGEHYYLISLAVILTGLTGGFLSYEGKKDNAAYIICISIFTVIGILSRIVLSPVPQVKPVAAIVILSGVALGKEAGFVTGAMSMFLSNFYFMQGAWTPFQMFAMGVIGFTAGALFSGKEVSAGRRVALSVYGFFAVLLIYGLIVDANTLFFALGDDVTTEGIAGVYLAGLPFDLVFAVTTFLFLFFLYYPIMKIWLRLEKKYKIVV
ncbi:MAG TPA: ECF transporter S component [Lachnospiraceae bacterium]|nr:ECF transporter S component [Lachnospiraceae bacterium]